MCVFKGGDTQHIKRKMIEIHWERTWYSSGRIRSNYHSSPQTKYTLPSHFVCVCMYVSTAKENHLSTFNDNKIKQQQLYEILMMKQ